MGQSPLFLNQLYLDHTFQVPMKLQYGMAHPRYPEGMQIPTAQAIAGYFGYPPPSTGLVPQGY